MGERSLVCAACLTIDPSALCLSCQIESKAKSDDKYPEAFAGLMKEPGMTK